MSKLYRIDGGRYGGEFCLGTVSNAFVEYWVGKEEYDLLNHLTGLEWEDEDFDPNSPPVFDDGEGYNGWYEIDDLEHMNSCFADSDFTVTLVEDRDDLYAYSEDEISLESANSLYNREGGYLSNEYEEGMLPALAFFSSEKGSFGSYFLELPDDEEFDPKKLRMGLCETELCDLIDCMFYDGKELECEYDYSETTGKAYHCAVGWYKPEWRETLEQYAEGSERFKEYLEDYLHEIENEE